jgi:hypothetical protein
MHPGAVKVQAHFNREGSEMPDFRQQVASSILAGWPRPSSLSEHRPIPAYLENQQVEATPQNP